MFSPSPARGLMRVSSSVMPWRYTPRQVRFAAIAVMLVVVPNILRIILSRRSGRGGGRELGSIIDGDPSGLIYGPGAADRRASQVSLFEQKLAWRVAHPIENVSFGFLYYLGSPIPGAVEAEYIRELRLSIKALACSSFEEKNIVVATDTVESRDQLRSALQGQGMGKDAGWGEHGDDQEVSQVSISFQVVKIPRELTDINPEEPSAAKTKTFLEAVERCRRRSKDAATTHTTHLCYRVQMTMKAFSLAQSPFDATLSLDPDVFVNFLNLRRDNPRSFNMKRFKRVLHSADWVGVAVLCFEPEGCPLRVRGHNGGWLFYLLHPATRAFIHDLATRRMIDSFPRGNDQTHLETAMLE